MNITIIGLGLIGGSVGLRLKKINSTNHIIGVDRNQSHGILALDLGLIDELKSYDEALKIADLVIICTPVNIVLELLPEVLDNVSENTVVIDMGSTKADICDLISEHPNRNYFVATHPIAGTENSGPEAAFESLFEGKTGIICDAKNSNKKAVILTKEIYNSLGMKVVDMDSKSHDLHIAYVSHLSHISSFVLGQTVLEMENDEENIFNMAGSGFASTVRLAKSSPAMWAPIFTQNKKHISQSLDDYIENLKIFKQMIDDGNTEGMFNSMKQTNKIRNVLDGIDIQALNAEPKLINDLDKEIINKNS